MSLPPVSLEGPRIDAGNGLVLRPVEPADAQELFALVDANREDLRRWLPWVDATREASDTLRFIEGAVRQCADGRGFVAVMLLKGAIAGVIGHHDFDRKTRTASLGYWLAAAYRGRGRATAACRAMVEDAFGRLGAEQVTIACAPDNRASRAIPERLGFVPLRTVRAAERLHDRTVDHVVYGIDRRAWTASPAVP